MPRWLRSDDRPLAEEYFRHSFATGIWAQGEIIPKFYYKTTLANNLSQLGIDTGQLNGKFGSWSTVLWRVPKSHGRMGAFGDLEDTQDVGGAAGLSFTISTEEWQSQPNAKIPQSDYLTVLPCLVREPLERELRSILPNTKCLP